MNNESDHQNARIRRNHIRDFHQQIETKPDVFNFYSNVISSILTLVALIVTIYFSLSALNKTDTQNKNAVEQLIQAKAQLILAQQQFQYSKQLHSEDLIASSIKDRITNERFIKDTIKQGQQERSQELRYRLQVGFNKQQYTVNKGQLKAIEIQAKTAEAQFFQSQDQYKQQQYEQRPIFNIDSVSVTSINMVKSSIRFNFSNSGIRSAHVDSTILAFYNPKELCLSVTSNTSNLDLVPRTSFLSTSPINIYQACLNSNLTVYYLLIYYRDKTTGVSQVEPIFFKYEYSKNKQFMWSRVTGPLKAEFANKLKIKKVLVIE
ncbi:MAG: hypothetical protein JWR05_3369 [Mucilaginibacter sp.]|nr:hypothetical protein [Mucilaginibacter sp.]